jgi:hypothetical protein
MELVFHIGELQAELVDDLRLPFILSHGHELLGAAREE